MTKRFTAKRETFPPIPFELETIDGDASVVQAFHAVGKAPVGALVHMLDSVTPDGVRVVGAMAFLDGVIVDEDQDRWRRVVEDKGVVVDANLLTDIALYLFSEYGKRPTAPPTD